MYDYDEYESELRGFYLNVPADLPNDVVKTEAELLKQIRNEDFDYDRLADFNRRFNPYNDGQASAKIVRRVFNED